MSKPEWTPSQGEVVWIKVFSNWSKGTYIGYDVIKNQHLVREAEEGGGHLFVSANVLPEHANPNEPKIDKKQNSVEWLAQAIYDKMKMRGDGKVFQGILDEALAMHKEEMIQFANKYESHAHMATISNRYAQLKSAEHYYNETFGGNNE